MKHKKGRLWTFVFSLLPGAAEMYMGFMKRGVSIMAVFFACWIIPSVLRLSDVFAMIGILVWFYGFFHARNLAACSEEEIQNIPDNFIWESWGDFGKIQISSPTLRKWGAVILILTGLSLLWKTVYQMIYDILPEIIWKYLSPLLEGVPQIVAALIIIVVGVKLIAGKKEELNGKGE